MAPDPGGAGGPFGVLFVCTGNICRSPTAEALARRELERYPGVPIQVSSAGSHALEGNPAASRSMLAASTRGASLERHFARELTRRRVRSAGLVLCMAAEHRPFVLSYDRSAASRTFLLVAVSGFGTCMIAFALSRSFALLIAGRVAMGASAGRL